MNDFLESEEFYNAMQAYRHAPLDGQERVIECFEKVKSMVRAELAQIINGVYNGRNNQNQANCAVFAQ